MMKYSQPSATRDVCNAGNRASTADQPIKKKGRIICPRETSYPRVRLRSDARRMDTTAQCQDHVQDHQQGLSQVLLILILFCLCGASVCGRAFIYLKIFNEQIIVEDWCLAGCWLCEIGIWLCKKCLLCDGPVCIQRIRHNMGTNTKDYT